jgi:DNA replicative helicase MCM subunit Mcm2 (Cdc46/Mcm family)
MRYTGKFVSIRGTVVRVSNIKPLVLRMNFKCSRCQAELTQIFVDGKFSMPTKCTTSQCRSKTYTTNLPLGLCNIFFSGSYRTVLRLLPSTGRKSGCRNRCEPFSTAVINANNCSQLADDADSGRVPRTIECDLAADLVDRAVPGDVVTVTGIVKVVNIEAERGACFSFFFFPLSFLFSPSSLIPRHLSLEQGRGKISKNKSMFYIYIDANNIQNMKSVASGMSYSSICSVTSCLLQISRK